MAKLIFINLPVSDLARAAAFLSGDRRRQERAAFRRYGIMHGIFRYHPYDADDTRKVSAVHQPSQRSTSSSVIAAVLSGLRSPFAWTLENVVPGSK
jgi:hypothetical protein